MTDRTQMTAEGRALYSLWLTGSDYDTLDPKIADAIAALEARASLDVAPHPGEHHEFRTTCLRCGEPGWLHVSLLGPDETFTIASREEPTQPTINEYGRAMCACGVSVLPENWPNHLLSQQRGPHRAALEPPT